MSVNAAGTSSKGQDQMPDSNLLMPQAVLEDRASSLCQDAHHIPSLGLLWEKSLDNQIL